MNLDYQIALTNVQFDNSYKNVLRFDTRSEQEAYFQTNTLFSNSPDVNFNVGSLYATNVVYDGNENENINELLNKNYCIVKDKRENATIKYYYYYVTNAKQDCDNRILLALELDIFQTYYIDLNFSDCFISKAHLNRFIDNGNGTVSFDGTPQSELFEREDIQNVSKRITKRTKINNTNFIQSDLNTWLEENVYGWVYLFLDPTHSFKIFRSNGESVNRAFDAVKYISKNIEYENGDDIPSNLPVIAFPVYVKKDTSQIYGETKNRIRFNAPESPEIPNLIINQNGLERFLANNNDASFVYAMKFSTATPFSQDDFIESDAYSIDANNNLVFKCFTEPDNTDRWTGAVVGNYLNNFYGIKTNSGTGIALGGIVLQRIVNTIKLGHYTLNKKFTFTKEEIIGADKNPIFNPKLLSTDYFELRVNDSTENGFVYDAQKLNMKEFNLLLTEPMVPDLSKKYIRIETDGSGLYNSFTMEDLTGFINNNDNSLILNTDAYKAMLAQNKNFFLQNQTNRNISVGLGLAGGAITTIAGAATLNPLAIIAGISTMVGAGMNYSKNQINENLTIDNLKNAPDQISQAKGNIIFESSYSKVGVFIEEFEILENEKNIINDYMCLYGFTYNKVNNIKNVDNIRKIYNFVRADIETINSSNVSISETVREKFRECFANGVRFWNTDTFAYNKENYERWLEDASTINKANISWTQDLGKYIVAEYDGQEYTGAFQTNTNDTITFKCAINRSISITNIESDGTVEMSKPNAYTAVLTYTNATYINMQIKVYDIT